MGKAVVAAGALLCAGGIFLGLLGAVEPWVEPVLLLAIGWALFFVGQRLCGKSAPSTPTSPRGAPLRRPPP